MFSILLKIVRENQSLRSTLIFTLVFILNIQVAFSKPWVNQKFGVLETANKYSNFLKDFGFVNLFEVQNSTRFSVVELSMSANPNSNIAGESDLPGNNLKDSWFGEFQKCNNLKLAALRQESHPNSGSYKTEASAKGNEIKEQAVSRDFNLLPKGTFGTENIGWVFSTIFASCKQMIPRSFILSSGLANNSWIKFSFTESGSNFYWVDLENMDFEPFKTLASGPRIPNEPMDKVWILDRLCEKSLILVVGQLDENLIECGKTSGFFVHTYEVNQNQ